jgi:PAS domain S-box-containing protein
MDGETEEATHAALWDAVRSGLILRSDSTYTFLHDRIREAAYALVPDDERAMAHLRIGRALAAETPAKDLEENIFEIVNQFGRGAALITTEEECEQVAQLNLLAGKRARAAAAWDAALQYFIAGHALLAEGGWERCYRLTFDLELNWAECECLVAELTSAEQRLARLALRARTTVDAAAVTCVRINLYTTLDQSDSAVRVGLEYLRRVDGEWSPHATAEDVRQAYVRLWQQLGSGSIEAQLDLPLMQDPERCATMDVLTVLTSPALFTSLNLFRLVVNRMATLSLEYGNGDGSCLAYAWLGGVLGTYFGEYEAGLRFGTLGLDLVEKRGLGRFRARVYLVFAVHVAHWTQPLQTSRAYLRRAFEAALEAGDLSYAAYSCIDLITNRIATGDSLGEVEREAEHGLEFARKLKFGLASDCITGQLRLVRMLRGLTPDFGSFNDAEFDERSFEQRLDNDPQLAIGASYYWIRRLQASVYAGNETSAIVAESKAALLLWTTPTQFELAEYHFYGALAGAAYCDSTPDEERPRHLETLAAHQKQLAVWAEHCPATFADRAALAGAEIARLERRDLEAMRLYEDAIRLARKYGFIQNEGLANECAARFCAARGFQTMADAHLRNARDCYLCWGADGKVRQLDQRHPNLSEKEPVPAPMSTIGAPVEHLDLATVLKVSQAVSGEIVLDKLLDTLMRTALEHAGAERGLMILSREAGRHIVAEAMTGGDSMSVLLRNEPATAAALPESILHYVVRTGETVIVDDAAAENPFAADTYLRQHPARSILCLPLSNQSKLIGVLYLENNLAPRVFAPGRITVLKLLASQAAIALENARLYGDLAEREAKIRSLVDTSIIGIFIWELAGSILEANDAFLRMVGHDRADLAAGLRWIDLTPPEWRDRHQQSWVPELKQTGSVQPYEKEYFRKDGSRVPVLVGSASLDEARNQGVAFVLDLTERKRAEQALHQAQATLAHLTRVMTAGELTASIAHEVNQPLAALAANSSACLRWLARQPPDLDEARACLQRMVRDSHRAGDVITRIRALIKKSPPIKVRLDLNEAIQEVLALTGLEARRQGVLVRTELAASLPPVRGDWVQLQQVIMNLVMNGIDAMKESTGRPRELLIRSRPYTAGSVVVAVHDTGIGLEAARLERLFEAFYTTKPDGMGMGLSISRSIIEAHGGQVWPSANDDYGVTFQFTLPTDEVHDGRTAEFGTGAGQTA